jgi:integrase
VPRIHKPRIRINSKDFSYLRTDEEVRRFLRAAAEEGEMVEMLNKTAFYTGARAGELAGLEWPDIDFETRLITIQRSFDGPTKSDEVRHVPILDVLLPDLKRWKLRHPGRLVFTNRDGSTGTMLRMHPSFKAVGRSPFDDGQAIVDPTTPERVAADAIRMRNPGVVQLCTTVEIWLGK